jgi:hypothetical protein
MIILGVVLIGFVVVGAFALVVLLGLFAVGYAEVWVRARWRWLKLLGGKPLNSVPEARSDKSARYFEGEYEVVEAEADARRRNSGTR